MEKRVALVISEPFDFAEATFRRSLRGRLTGEEPTLIELDQPVSYNGRLLRWFVGGPRHTDDSPAGLSIFGLIGVERLDAEPAEVLRRWRGTATGIAIVAQVNFDKGI